MTLKKFVKHDDHMTQIITLESRRHFQFRLSNFIAACVYIFCEISSHFPILSFKKNLSTQMSLRTMRYIKPFCCNFKEANTVDKYRRIMEILLLFEGIEGIPMCAMFFSLRL